MNIETVFFKATDEVQLNGLIYKSENKAKKVIISVHGMNTNCIKQRDQIIAENINKYGIDLLAFNNRGHDLTNYIAKNIDGKTEKALAGTSYEEISECYYDILGAIEFLIKNNYEEIYLMGHSLGSTKTVYAYNKLLDEKSNLILDRIKGIILLSLVDIPMAVKIYLKEDFAPLVTYAKNMQKENMEEALMPKESFIYPISIKTFLRYAINNHDIDFAKFSDSSYDFEKINNITVPLFMRWGNNNEMILQKADDLCDILRLKIKNQNFDIGYIDGADHSYHGKEEKLAKEITEFLKNI